MKATQLKSAQGKDVVIKYVNAARSFKHQLGVVNLDKVMKAFDMQNGSVNLDETIKTFDRQRELIVKAIMDSSLPKN